MLTPAEPTDAKTGEQESVDNHLSQKAVKGKNLLNLAHLFECALPGNA